MKQSRHSINPRLNVKAGASVQYDDRPRVNLYHILNQRILLFWKAERAIVAFSLVLFVRAESENDGIITRKCCGRLYRSPAYLQAANP
jgi:hypothetical protein